MSNYAFPAYESLQKSTATAKAKATAASEVWVEQLSKTAEPPRPPSAGWSPPTVESVFAPSIDLEAERQMAHEEGFATGYSAGIKAGKQIGIADGRREGRTEVVAQEQAAIEAFRMALADAVSQVQPAVDRWQENLESRAAELAMEMVRSLLAAELATNRPTAIGIVREAMGHAEGATRATVRLSPFDRAALAEHRDEIMAACAGLRDLELVDDHSITGGCIVETENGVVDATLTTRLSLLEAA